MTGDHGITRRSALVGASAGGGVLLLAACSSSAKEDKAVAGTVAGSSAADTASAETTSAQTSTAETTAPTTAPPATAPPASGTKVVALADVPVGGAVSATGKGDAKLIVAQPTAGQVVAFSAICTHQGCTVAPGKTELDCPCHGSKYDMFTGKVLNPPANQPLASVAVSVVGGNVVQA